MIDDLSIIVPVGVFSNIPIICQSNIDQYFGHNVDLIFLVHRNTDTATLKAIKKTRARILVCPFENGSDHCKLLDWAMYYGDLKDWVLIQHADLFWQGKNFLSNFEIIKNDKDFFIISKYKKFNFFIFDKKEYPLLDDVATLFRRDKFIEHKLSLRSGIVNRLDLSSLALDFITKGKIKTRIYEKEKILSLDSWLDGGHSLTIELLSRNLFDNVVFLDSINFWHPSQFFRIHETWINSLDNCQNGVLQIKNKKIYREIKIENNNVEDNSNIWQWAFYSWFTSHCCDSNQKSFPWLIFKQIYKNICCNNKNKFEKLEIMEEKFRENLNFFNEFKIKEFDFKKIKKISFAKDKMCFNISKPILFL
jgi:hypothetical protein